MRVFLRLHALVACAFVSILYLGWVYPSFETRTRLLKAWSGSAGRVVVFGDDWSDTGSYRVAPPSPEAIPVRAVARGEIWTESLCKELLCDHIDNFARSTLVTGRNYAQVIVDNNRLADASDRLADFREQVQQWITFEKQKRLVASRKQKSEDTVFTVLFGLWDLLEYVHLGEAAAKQAVDSTVLAIFQQLDVVAENAAFPVRITLPLGVDISLLPGFAAHVANSSSGLSLAQMQHHAVYLSAYWNAALMSAAERWDAGDLFMPNLNTFVLSHVQAKQLWALQITDASGAGQHEPLFGDVQRPCLSQPNMLPDLGASDQINGSASTESQNCNEPSRHLFWDGLHLSGKAMQLFGSDTASLVRRNQTVNADARSGIMVQGDPEPSNFEFLLPPEHPR